MPTAQPAAGKKRRAFTVLAAFVFCWMLLLNCLTPYIADDFAFAYAFDTGLRLQSLPQLIQSLAYHYYEWSGRIIVKFFAQGFTMFPKWVFNFCNAAAYLGLGVVIYRLARGRRSGRYDLAAFVLIQAALWEQNPAFGQTNLWMCGACNYLLSTLGCLAFLLPWRYNLQKPFTAGRWLPLGMAGAGLLAGWAMENTSAGLLVCLALCLGAALAQQKRAPLWMWTGFGGTLAGFVALIAARGNYNRAASYTSESLSFVTKYAMRFFNCLNMLKENALPLLLAFAVLYLLLWWQMGGKNTDNALLWPVILLLGGLGANFAMLASADYYPRSFHGPLAFLTAACAACLVRLDARALRRAFACVAASAVVVCAFHACEAGYDIASYYIMEKTRDTLIRTEIAQTGAREIVSYGIEPYTKWCAATGLPDIRADGGDSIGLGRARWYGVDSLTAQENRTYPFPGHTNAAYEAGISETDQ